MNSKLVVSKLVVPMLLACASPAMVHAAQPPDPALLKQCESAQGQVEEECKKVAREMMKPPEAQQPRNDKTGQDVTHSSPVMDAEPNDTQVKDAQTENRQAKDKQSKAAQSKQAQSKQAQPKPAKPAPPKQEDNQE